jgi:hypothetical protein
MKKLNRKLNLLQKITRAEVIRDHLHEMEVNRCVCFTSGTAAECLKRQGLQVIAVGDQQPLNTAKWWTFTDIAFTFGVFDATAGHLPIPLMAEIAARLKKQLKTLPKHVTLATGSGETLVCLKMAFPNTKFTAVYNLDGHTEYSANAPLNSLVELLADEIVYN